MWTVKIYRRIYVHRLAIPMLNDPIMTCHVELPFVPFPGLRLKIKLNENGRQWFHLTKITWNGEQNCFETWLSPDKSIPTAAARNSGSHVTVFDADAPERQDVLDTYLRAGWWTSNPIVNHSGRDTDHCFIWDS